MKTKRLFAILLSMLLVLALVPASAFADVDLSEWGSFRNPDQPTTFYVTEKDINSYLDLAPLVNVDGITTIIITTSVNTNDLSTLQQLGQDLPAGSKIPKIDSSSSNIQFGLPIRVLPAHNGSRFAASVDVKENSGHTILQNYTWHTKVTYVYDKTRNNNVRIDHQVVDAEEDLMLQYADDRSRGPVTNDEQYIYINGINSPDYATADSDYQYRPFYEYLNVIRANTTDSSGGEGSGFSINQSYKYLINADFYSAIKLNLPVAYIGRIEITKVNPDQEPLAGAVFKLYRDKECKEEASRLDANGNWVAVGEFTTGADGKATVDGLLDGVYYAKEIKAPAGYILNKEVFELPVIGQYGNFVLNFTGGEGNSLTINKENVDFVPDWTGNAAAGSLELIPAEGSTETASAYAMGKDVFFKAHGAAVAYNDPTAAASVDANAANNPTYTLTVGQISQTFTSLSSLLAYVNDELIGNGVIDAENARDLVTVTPSVDTVYIPYASTAASITVVDEYIPIDVTVNKSFINATPAQIGEYVVVQLYCDGEPVSEEDGGIVELNEENEWTYTWEGLEGNHEYTVKEPNVPENFVASYDEGRDETDDRIYITVDITNEYVQAAPITFDNTAMLLIAGTMMILAVCYLAIKISKTPTK
ncbi:MAG: Cna B-type domain-containing protein [Firmicutes bacterium]|nr:Cna B-type domain-containing protein [Bacillota bacterium]